MRFGRLRLGIALCGILAALVLEPSAKAAPTDSVSADLEVTFIDVGQGDSTWIHTSDGWDVLIDGGDTDKAAVVTGLLEANQVNQIDAIIATHPHADHIGGLASVVATFPVDLFVSNGQSANTATYRRLVAALATAAVPTVIARVGTQFSWGCCVHASVLHPADLGGTDNDNSLVIMVTNDTCDVLMTGDVELNGEGAILARGTPIAADVLKVAHHGSITSSSEAFLAAVRPVDAIISVGRNNSYGHPSPVVLERLADVGARVHRTDLVGSVTVVSDEIGCRRKYPEDSTAEPTSIVQPTAQNTSAPTDAATAAPTAGSRPTDVATAKSTAIQTSPVIAEATITLTPMPGPTATATPEPVYLPYAARLAVLIPPPAMLTPTETQTAIATAASPPTPTRTVEAPTVTNTPLPPTPTETHDTPTATLPAILMIGTLGDSHNFGRRVGARPPSQA